MALNRRQQLDHLRSRWIPDDSFAEAMLSLVDSGYWTELEAAAALQRLYEQAFANGQAAERPWITEAMRLLEERTNGRKG